MELATRNFCDARKRQGEGTCKHEAGWGTDHVGKGHCRLHGGSTRQGAKGSDNPNFRHGLYAEHMSPEELVGFEEWAAHFELSNVGIDDLYGIYRLQKGLGAPGPIPLPLLAQTVNLLAGARLKYRTLVEGQVIKIDLTDSLLAEIMAGFEEVLLAFVPEERIAEAIAALQVRADRACGKLGELVNP